MRSGMIAFAAGVVVTGFCPSLPEARFLVWVIVSNTIGYWVLYCRQNKWAASIACCLLFLLGMFWHVANAQHRLHQRLPTELEGVDFLVRGYVAGLPEFRDINQQFLFYIESAANGFQGRKILLNYYGAEIISASQHWQFLVRLKRPHGFANPGTFDYEAWLFQQGVSAKGYVRDSTKNQLMANSRPSVLSARDSLRRKIISVTEGLSQQALMLALALGERSLISNLQWQVFSRTGTNHLVVVSGLHIGFIAGMCFLAGSYLWRLFPRLMLWIPAQHSGAISALAGAGLYSLLAGFSLPTQRALVMVAVFMLARLLAVRQSPFFSLLLSLLVVLLLDPFAALTAGFWLSFTAVASLLLVFAGTPAESNQPILRMLWTKWGKAQWVVFIALLLPLSIWIGEFSLLAPIANIIAIPLVSWLVVPLCLLGTAMVSWWPDFASVFFVAADYLLQGLTFILEWIAFNDLLAVTWRVKVESKLLIVFGGMGCLLLLLPSFGNTRLLALLLFLPLLFPRHQIRTGDTLELHVLDVGQGLATIVRTRNHVLVYDTGAGFVDGFDSGAQLVVPVLSQMGVEKVDILVVSHGDNDHSGGAAGLIQGIEVNRLLSSEADLTTALTPEPCSAGQQWTWDSVQFSMLHPPVTGSAVGLNRNNRSCVLHIEMGEHTILLPGDIEARVERELIQGQNANLAADILVAAHHGSNTSSTSRFIATLSPEFVIFSAGYLNQFRHPADQVEQRFQQAGVRLFNTADSGMISFYLEKGKTLPRIQLHRNPRKHYWN